MGAAQGRAVTKGMRKLAFLVAPLVFACSESADPFRDASTTPRDSGTMADAGLSADSGLSEDAAAGADTGTMSDAGQSADAGAVGTCAPIPTRMVVLGDSIMACQGAGGKMAATCGPKALHTVLEGSVAPGLTYENNAVSGAVTAGVANMQLGTVAGGPGHVLVLIYIGGNDLAQYIFVTDQAAQSGYDAALPGIIANWRTIFDYFADRTRFPDGATLIMNTQYDPFDDCTAPPYNLSAAKIALLHDFNLTLQTIAEMSPSAHLTDQFTPFLGHGHHNAVASCPYYEAGKDNWMSDLIHANNAGHANFVIEWRKITDAMYVNCH